ncbi:S15/NS1 RNA-binding domain-containing protein [Cylindrobasidium torrendii FP15055 ss-10]|uniref:S15/NS1 RNA-binding domain-containing protein n=1 Tax=Cylindrobasidium torrendii FP15055 ss-10 TaxID=1314674 RepID=A0A0D7BSG1_9AGAR|nr:S15/NS1 RNA-binding domain-containing protein [Cylindrobasidium torrendii FP15055 ss-10]
MLKSCFAQATRSLASTSSHSFIHTSVVLRARAEDVSRRLRREAKYQRRMEEKANLPSPILGTRPGDDDKWLNCDLSKVLIDESILVDEPKPNITETQVGTIPVPQLLSYGITEAEIPLLFKTLPEVSSTRELLSRESADPASILRMSANPFKTEQTKAGMFAASVDLRNANLEGIHFVNRNRIIREFSTEENPFDPGRIEVQAAILTYRIRNMHRHMTMKRHKKDVASKRRIRELVYHRARVLKYLKRMDMLRYDVALTRLGLEPGAVEGELMV